MSDIIVAAIEVKEIDGQLLVDSRLIAERLGIQHEVLIRTTNKYLNELQGFGHLRFENGTVTNSVGARNTTRFVYFNEDQATLLMTMSRNTTQVVQCKVELVAAFKKAKSIIKTVIPAQSDRIRELELEIQLRNAEAQSAQAQKLLLDTRHYITTVLPEPVQQKILGYTEVKTVEYVDRTIAPSGEAHEGVGITYIQKRFGFKSTKQAWDWLESIGYGKLSGHWETQLAAIERQSLPRELLSKLDSMAQQGNRQQYLGEEL